MKIPGIYQDKSICKSIFLIIAAYVGGRETHRELIKEEIIGNTIKRKTLKCNKNNYNEVNIKNKNLNTKEKHKEKIYSFISHDMKMYSIETVKIALSSNDNKRIPMKEDPFMTYAIGHYKN